jgi:hypothetical protein
MTDGNPRASSPIERRWFPAGFFWVINLALLFAIAGWIFVDGRALGKLQELPGRVSVGAAIVVGLILASLIGILAGLFQGPAWRRSLKAWLAFTALVSAWCALCVSCPSLCWFGQTVRLRGEVPAYAALAQELRDHWPGEDGDSPTLGPFLAYPLGNPQTLLLIGVANVPGGAPVAAVERSVNGALRFQLAGAEAGAWLEWHPEGSAPESFIGGLQTPYELLRQAELQPGWYLVRYRE